MADCFLSVRGITKRFGTLVANDNICMDIEAGTVHAIIGENGAGKSTLMNILAGIHIMDEGEIILNGDFVNFRSPTDAREHGIGMVHQEFMLCPELTILDNIILGFELKKGILIDRKRAKRAIEEICTNYNFPIPLDEVAVDQPVAILQQVEIVKVLYQGAKIIIFDEPTSVLTPQGIEGLFTAIRYLIAQGKTIIFITHKLKEVLAISDEITVLKNGRVTGHVKTRYTCEQELAGMMIGREVLLSASKYPKDICGSVLVVNDLKVRNAAGILKLKGIDLSVRAGEIVGIAGIAGSGQIELMESLYGLCRVESGTVHYKGVEITRRKCRERRCMGVGLIPQDRINDAVNLKGSIWENCIMGYHVAHGFGNKLLLNHRQARAFTQSVVDAYSVKTADLETPVSSLSGGNVQKLIVGREFMQKNDLLIIVDPTRGIDIGTIEFIWQEIVKIAASGVGILLISQDLNEVCELSDHIFALYDGRLYDCGSYGETSEYEIGLKMMGGGVIDK